MGTHSSFNLLNALRQKEEYANRAVKAIKHMKGATFPDLIWKTKKFFIPSAQSGNFAKGSAPHYKALSGF